MKHWITGHRWVHLSVAVALLSGGVAVADDDNSRVYHWKDASGTSHYGDAVPPEFAGTGHSVLNRHGVEVEKVAGALSEEEIAEAKRQAVLRDAEKQAELRDKVLLSTYLSVEEIEALRDRRVELLGAQIRITQKYLDDLRGRLVKLEREAQKYSPYSSDPGARPIDEKLARELSDTLNSILLYEKTMAKSLSEQRDVQEKFAADIQRFIELRGLSHNR